MNDGPYRVERSVRSGRAHRRGAACMIRTARLPAAASRGASPRGDEFARPARIGSRPPARVEALPESRYLASAEDASGCCVDLGLASAACDEAASRTLHLQHHLRTSSPAALIVRDELRHGVITRRLTEKHRAGYDRGPVTRSASRFSSVAYAGSERSHKVTITVDQYSSTGSAILGIVSASRCGQI